MEALERRLAAAHSHLAHISQHVLYSLFTKEILTLSFCKLPGFYKAVNAPKTGRLGVQRAQ